MIIIGEKINGSIPSVGKAIAEKDADFIRNLAKAQAEAGVDYIDVCASVDEDIEVETLKWMIDLVQEVTDIPIAVDSPSARVCAEALKFCKKPGLVNSVSMEGDKTDVVFPVIADTSWECVALLCDDTGIPKSAEKRLEVFEEIMKKAKEYNIDPSRLHIDPLVEMLCTSEDGINMIVNVMKEIKAQYPTIHITGAISNISFNLPVRRLVNQAFAVLAMNAGMDSFILDPLNKDLMGMLYATKALLGEDEYCMEYITKYREGVFGNKKK
ncbi:MAG: methyltetrahydrofolate cobalamin methyltransferase [Firmicutes bacterium]|nr:methyltetrahydrofolate cobalamin methyltransferase [Bacillota bacterium]